ncbi:hypothetical protein ACJX0J_040624, partial [Zea mays]
SRFFASSLKNDGHYSGPCREVLGILIQDTSKIQLDLFLIIVGENILLPKINETVTNRLNLLMTSVAIKDGKIEGVAKNLNWKGKLLSIGGRLQYGTLYNTILPITKRGNEHIRLFSIMAIQQYLTLRDLFGPRLAWENRKKYNRDLEIDCELDWGDYFFYPILQNNIHLIKMMEYLSTPLVLRVPRREAPFKLYIVAEDKITSVVLTQEDDGQKYVLIYID